MRGAGFLAAAAVLIAAASCSVGRISGRPAALIGGDWDRAVPRIEKWAAGAPGRGFQVQDLNAERMRVHPPLDSLILADAWRRAGLEHPMLRRLPTAPRKAGILCRENYIFYLRGNQIVGVEYRAVVSDGWGGHRQIDDAVGEISESPPSST